MDFPSPPLPIHSIFFQPLILPAAKAALLLWLSHHWRFPALTGILWILQQVKVRNQGGIYPKFLFALHTLLLNTGIWAASCLTSQLLNNTRTNSGGLQSLIKFKIDCWDKYWRQWWDFKSSNHQSNLKITNCSLQPLDFNLELKYLRGPIISRLHVWFPAFHTLIALVTFYTRRKEHCPSLPYLKQQ